MRHGSLFSGIGGFDLAAQWMGWENVFHCEWNEFGQKVLNYYWPKAISYNDITKTDFTIHRGNIDILTGGFPCQPYSAAGKRLGKEDDRHLWPSMLRAIREIQPTYIVAENVRGLTNWNGGMVFNEVQADMEAEGYQVTPFLLPACAVNGGAPHRRDRIWFVAHSVNRGRWGSQSGEHDKTYELSGKNRKEWSGGGMSNGTDNVGDGRERETHKIHNKRKINTEGTTTNTKRNGLEHSAINGFERQLFKQQGEEGVESSSKRIESTQADGIRRTTTNTSGKGCEGSKFNGTSESGEREHSEPHGATSKLHNVSHNSRWQNFPTQSPICSGDDGLSSRLAGITFPKFRNESIKAYGNAIVPQIAYEIFLAIK